VGNKSPDCNTPNIFTSLKIDPYLKDFNEACSEAVQCGDELSFDETLYPNR
jgi:hypothetical protein